MSLELIVGCMFAGKTTEIIRIVKNLKHIGITPIIIKPKIDNRYSSDKISSHDNQEYSCITLNDLSEFKNPSNKKYIIIEEAQFFNNLYDFVIKQVDEYDKNIIVVGLDGDSNRQNFGEIHKLLPICDNIRKLKAYCSVCKDGTKALFSKRIVDNDKQVLVGSKEFIPVCRKCYK